MATVKRQAPLIWLIKLYQFTLAGLFGPVVCRFEPSCSAYAVEAIEAHGVICGFLLTLWRLLRCQPFCSGGIDPVPKGK